MNKPFRGIYSDFRLAHFGSLHWINCNVKHDGRKKKISSMMSVSLVSNVYLDENSTRIRSKPVPWEVCLSNLLNETDHSTPTLAMLRATNAQAEWLQKNSLWLRKLTDNQKQRQNRRSYQMDRLMLCFISGYWRNWRGMIPCHVFWFSLGMLLLVRVFLGYSRIIHLRFSLPDHDERIPLFTRSVESDPELPYTPLLKYAIYAFGRHVLIFSQGHSRHKTNSSNLKLHKS